MNETKIRTYFAQLGFPADVWNEFKKWIAHQEQGVETKTYYRHDVERFVMRVQVRLQMRLQQRNRQRNGGS